MEHTGSITLALAEPDAATSFPVEISLSEMIGRQQQIYVAMIRDVTERKRFEEAMRAEKKASRSPCGSIGDGVITTDVQGNVMINNAACETLTGWSAAEAVGQTVQDSF